MKAGRTHSASQLCDCRLDVETTMRYVHIFEAINRKIKNIEQKRAGFRDVTMNAFEAAEKTGRAAELEKELVALFAKENRSPDKNKTSIPATFLCVTVRV